MPETPELSTLISDYAIPWGINIALALAVFVIGRWVSKMIVRLIERLLRRSKMDEILVNFISSIASALLLLTLATLYLVSTPGVVQLAATLVWSG